MKDKTRAAAERIDRAHSDEIFAARPDNAARDELVNMFYPLAEYLARRFVGRGEPYDDLVQVAGIGLIKAIDRFDVDRGPKFSTYATATIVGELKRHFRDKCWALRVPRRLQDNSLRIRNVIAELHQELGRSPTVTELAEHSRLTEEDVLEGLNVTHAYSVDSLDTLTDDEGQVPFGDVGVDDESFEIREGWMSVSGAIQALPQRERKILYSRFFRDMKQSKIAAELGTSQMYVSRILTRTLRQLRESLGELDAS